MTSNTWQRIADAIKLLVVAAIDVILLFVLLGMVSQFLSSSGLGR